jgi:Flp pilus assembly pilin Flp
VEYALLLALIAFVCIGALEYFGGTNGGSINNSANSVISATN